MSRLLLALLLLIPLTARAETGEPIGDGKLARLALGWGGFAPKDAPAPVAVLLANDAGRERQLRVVITPENGARREVLVSLAPGARKRVAFSLRIEGKLGVSITENGAIVAASRHAASILPDGAVLLVDGEPESYAAADPVPGAIVFSCRPDEVPGELACLARFQGIVLRLVDPASFDPAARGALDDYVRSGGVVVVSSPAERPATRAFFDEAPGPAEPLEADYALKHRGLGRVVLAPEDLGAAAPPRGPAGLHVLAAARPRFPRIALTNVPNDGAARAGVILGGFLLAYFVLAGPVFVFGLRRAKPARVARAVGLLVPIAVALAALGALLVRGGSAKARAVTLTVIPRAGEPVAFSDVVLQSGGRREHDVVFEGDEVAATAFGVAGRRPLWDAWGHRGWIADSSATQRGKKTVTLERQALPPFGQTSFSLLGWARQKKPVDARIVHVPGRKMPLAVISNDCGIDLGRTVVASAVARDGTFELARFERVRNGTAVWAAMTRAGGVDDSLVGVEWPLDVDGLFEPPTEPDGRPARYYLVAEERAPIRVRGPEIDVEELSWRIQLADGPPAPRLGYLGIAVAATPRGLRITRVDKASPAATMGWRLSPGRTITALAGVPVRTVEDMKRVLAHVGARGRLRVATDNGTFDVQLGDPPDRRVEGPDGDALPPGGF